MQGTLKLCRFKEEDKPFFLLNQLEGHLLAVYLRDNRLYSKGELKGMRFDTEKERFFIMKNGKFPVAAITVQDIDFENTNCKLSITVFDEKVLQNFGEEIVKLALDYCFNQIDLHRIYGFLPEHEEYFLELLLAQGFIVEGKLANVYFDEGQYQHHYVLGLLRNDYFAKEETFHGK